MANIFSMSKTTAEYRAYDTVTEWSGPVRDSIEAAEKDAARHNKACADQGGYGSAEVVTRDPDAPSRLVDLRGKSVWPPHGRSTGAARWVEVQPSRIPRMSEHEMAAIEAHGPWGEGEQRPNRPVPSE